MGGAIQQCNWPTVDQSNAFFNPPTSPLPPALTVSIRNNNGFTLLVKILVSLIQINCPLRARSCVCMVLKTKENRDVPVPVSLLLDFYDWSFMSPQGAAV